MTTIRLTAAQALVRAMAAQMTLIDGQRVPIFAGIWAIFGHGNVAGMGEALYHAQDRLPTYRAHNEQGMAHAAVAFAKASRRRRFMACTTSIGPGATNLVTAAAVAHVNRLPLLLIPGDVFASRRPDPVLQQVEDFGSGIVSANDCLRPVSRYFDRISRPEQLISAFARTMAVLTDPAECGPVTLAFCQDVQAEAHPFPTGMFDERLWTPRRPRPDMGELQAATNLLRNSRKPFVIAGGGVLYSKAEIALLAFCTTHGIPVGETQAGKSSLPADCPLNLGAIGVTGTQAANTVAAEADLVLAVGTRLQDFTTGSWALFKNPEIRFVCLNTQVFDATKHRAQPMVADAAAGLQELGDALGEWQAPASWTMQASHERRIWLDIAAHATAPTTQNLPSDAEVIGALQRQAQKSDVIVGAAGGLPGELHKHWQAGGPGGYHMEYGFSCMGYEIAGGLGVKLADPLRAVFVLVGDGSYLMMNSEIATSVMLGQKLIIVVLNNGGYACINRLQHATGGAAFNNLLTDTKHVTLPAIDFAAHATSLGAQAWKVSGIAALESALQEARAASRTCVLVIDTDPAPSTEAGGHWWDVAVPQVSERPDVNAAHEAYAATQHRIQTGTPQ